MKPNVDFLKQHLSVISHPRDVFENRGFLSEVEAYIEKQFLSFGYTVEKQPFPFYNATFHNVVARQRNTPSPFSSPPGRGRGQGEGELSPEFNEGGPSFVIGAHFDAVAGTEGADDNASGVAVLLEAARLLANSKAAAQIDFAAFNVEEYGMVGSSHYVEDLKKKKIKIEGMISLEMVGFTSQEKGSQKIPIFLRLFYPDVGNFLALVADLRSKKFLNKAKKAFETVNTLPIETLTLPAKGWVLPEARLSDHSPFWDAGYPAVLVTDTSFFRNPHYHGPTDKIETLDLEFMAKVTEGVIRLATSLQD